MGEVINLNQYRKRKERAEKDGKAKANRAQHGLSRGERDRQNKERETHEDRLDGHRFETPDEPSA